MQFNTCLPWILKGRQCVHHVRQFLQQGLTETGTYLAAVDKFAIDILAQTQAAQLVEQPAHVAAGAAE